MAKMTRRRRRRGMLTLLLVAATVSGSNAFAPPTSLATATATATTSVASQSNTILRESGGSSDPHEEQVSTQQEMSAQERILRDAGLWEKANTDADATASPKNDALAELKSATKRNVLTAIVSVGLALGNYFWEYTHPVTPVQLLLSMQRESAPITSIGNNGKPTVVDFWAPWCENCKLLAPTLHRVEEEYSDRVNFVMVNGDLEEAWPLIQAFGVDAIPHLALVSAEGDVETALIGPVPKSILEADLDTLLDNAAAAVSAKTSTQAKRPIPYTMLDVFAGQPNDARRINFKSYENNNAEPR